MILLSLLFAWCFERVHMIVAAPNYGSLYNGFGAIDLTARRETQAPMAYRVLVPWLIRLLERLGLPQTRRLDAYQTLKILLEALAFWAIWRAWSLPVALASFLLLLVTIKFDYWDWAAELSGLALAMTGDLSLALPGAMLAGLSRETALLVPAAYLLRTGDLGGGACVLLAALLPLIFVRVYVGRRKLYCARWQLPYNLSLFRAFFKWQPLYHSEICIALVLSALSLTAIIHLPPAWPVPLAVLVAGWTLAKSDETRVFSAALPWLAAYLIGGL
jgi:hypothetical protein